MLDPPSMFPTNDMGNVLRGSSCAGLFAAKWGNSYNDFIMFDLFLQVLAILSRHRLQLHIKSRDVLALLILLRIISSYERLMFGLLYSYECDICSLLSLCLKASYLVFEGRVYQQVHGTAMGPQCRWWWRNWLVLFSTTAKFTSTAASKMKVWFC